MSKKTILTDAGLAAHNFRALRALAHMPMTDFASRLDEIVESLVHKPNNHEIYKDEKSGQWYIYLDYGANILGVAHLDTVVVNTPQNCFMHIVTQHAFTDAEELIVQTPFLDDRLGVYVLLYYLQHCFEDTFPFDILLTIDEESGRSSAKHFQLENHDLPEDRYKWGFQFDATGGDVAKTYAYGSKDWHEVLEEEGWKTEYGAYTDICYLQQLGVKMMNLSCGYYRYHGVDSYFKVSELDMALVRFMNFYNKHKDTKFEHTATQSNYSGTGYRSYGGYSGHGNEWDNWDDDAWYKSRYGTGKNTASTTSSVSHPQYTDGRPRDFAWIKDEDHLSTWCLYEDTHESVLGEKVSVIHASHFDSGGIAAQCKLCEKWFWDEELSFENGYPVCTSCENVVIDAGLQDYDVWMTEGGIIAVTTNQGKSRFSRIALPQDSQHVKICEKCGQPDWKDNGLNSHTCRWCAKSITQTGVTKRFPVGDEDDKDEDETMVDTKPMKPVLYSEEDPQCYCGKRGTHFSGATNTWYCETHYPSKILGGTIRQNRKNKKRNRRNGD